MGSALTPLCSRRREYLTLWARHLDGGAFWVLELSGEADIATLGLLRQELAHLATTNTGEAVVDVTRLEFCDVAAAQMILVAACTIPFTLRGAAGPVKRVFDLLDALQKQRLPHHLPASHPRGSSPSARPPLPAAGPGGALEHPTGIGDHGDRAPKLAPTSATAAPRR
jgi:anti-anti-sigma regulatory factor